MNSQSLAKKKPNFFEKIYRRIDKKGYRNYSRKKRIKQGLKYWEGANYPPSHPIFMNALTREVAPKVQELIIKFNKFPEYKILARLGTSDLNPFRQIFLEQFYLDCLKIKKCNINFILDLGANVGYTSMFYAMHYPQAQIASFEPSPSTFNQLQKQIQKSNCENRIKAYQYAIFTENKDLDFFVIGDGFLHQGNSLINRNENYKFHTKVKCLTLEKIQELTQFPTFDLIKIDVEGVEQTLFKNPSPSFNSIITSAQIIQIEVVNKELELLLTNYFKPYNYSLIKNNETITFFKSKLL